MATSVRYTFDQRDHIIEGVLDTTLKESPFWSRIKADGNMRVKVSANKMKRDYATQLATVRTIGKGQQLDGMRAEQAPGYQRATYEQSGYWTNDIFDGIELSQANGPQKVRPMTQSAINRIKSNLDTILKQEAMVADQTTSGSNIATGGAGLRFLGVLPVLNSTPTSGSLYGVARAACLAMQHQYVAGTAGINGSPITDIWDLINHMCSLTKWSWEEGGPSTDLILFSRTNYRIFQNKTQMQNQNVSTTDSGKTPDIYDGKEVDKDDYINADDVLGLNMSTWCFWTPRERVLMHRVIEGHPNYPIGTEVHDWEVHGSIICKRPQNNWRLHSVAI